MVKAMPTNKTYEVFSATTKFVEKHPNDYENLVALHSKVVSSFLDAEDGKTPDTIEGIVCIQNASNKRRRIYRRIVGSSTYGLDGSHAMLSNRNMNRLGIKEYDKIIISPTNWFCYLWNYYDATIRGSFRVAVGFGILSLLIGVLSLVASCACSN